MPDEIVDVSKNQINSLDESIKAANKDLLKDDSEGDKETHTDPKVDKKDEKKDSKDQKSDDDLSEEDLKLAIQMMKGLRDPEQAPGIIDYLAKQGGYTKPEIKELAKDLKDKDPDVRAEAKDELIEALTEQFGEDYAKKLGPVLTKVVEKMVDTKTKEIKESHQKQELEKGAADATRVFDSLAKEFYGEDEFPDEITKEISKILSTRKMSEGETMKDYLRDTYLLAAARKGGNTTKFNSTKQDRIDKNKTDIPAKFGNGRSPSASKDDKAPMTKVDLNEAIRLASDSLSKDN